MLPKYYTIKEVQECLRKSRSMIDKYIRDGKLDFEKLPGHTGQILFTEQHIENFRKKHMTV